MQDSTPLNQSQMRTSSNMGHPFSLSFLGFHQGFFLSYKAWKLTKIHNKKHWKVIKWTGKPHGSVDRSILIALASSVVTSLRLRMGPHTAPRLSQANSKDQQSSNMETNLKWIHRIYKNCLNTFWHSDSGAFKNNITMIWFLCFVLKYILPVCDGPN